MDFIEKLKYYIKDKGVTPYKIHKNTGVSQSTIGNYLRGNTNPDKDKVTKILEYLNSVDNGSKGDNREFNKAARSNYNEFNKLLNENISEVIDFIYENEEKFNQFKKWRAFIKLAKLEDKLSKM